MRNWRTRRLFAALVWMPYATFVVAVLALGLVMLVLPLLPDPPSGSWLDRKARDEPRLLMAMFCAVPVSVWLGAGVIGVLRPTLAARVSRLLMPLTLSRPATRTERAELEPLLREVLENAGLDPTLWRVWIGVGWRRHVCLVPGPNCVVTADVLRIAHGARRHAGRAGDLGVTGRDVVVSAMSHEVAHKANRSTWVRLMEYFALPARFAFAVVALPLHAVARVVGSFARLDSGCLGIVVAAPVALAAVTVLGGPFSAVVVTLLSSRGLVDGYDDILVTMVLSLYPVLMASASRDAEREADQVGDTLRRGPSREALADVGRSYRDGREWRSYTDDLVEKNVGSMVSVAFRLKPND